MFNESKIIKEQDTKKEKLNPLKAFGLMGMCCLLPLIVLTVLPLLNLGTKGSGFLALVSTFICPLMMLIMMGVMLFGGRKKNCCTNTKQEEK